LSKKIVTIIVAVLSCLCLLGLIFLFITQRNKAIEKKLEENSENEHLQKQSQKEEFEDF